MSNTTGIEWTDSTWNPIRGCSRVSKGCLNCYAERVAYRFSGKGQPYEGLAQLVNGHAAWTGKVDLVEKHLLDPLKWGRVVEHVAGCHRAGEAERSVKIRCNCVGRPRRIFVNSMSDLFHPNVPDEWIDRIFAVMALCSQHTFQVLTKRPERMLAYCSDDATLARIFRLADWIAQSLGGRAECKAWHHDDGLTGILLRNVHLGASVEDQKTADERIPLLLKTPAAVRFISAEPLLGAVNLGYGFADGLPVFRAAKGCRMKGMPAGNDLGEVPEGWYRHHGNIHPFLDWVIVGGESGPGARPMHPDWARGVRDQCAAAGVPFFFKQWGEWAPGAQQADYSRKGAAFTRIDVAGTPSNDPSRWAPSDALFYRVGKKAAGSRLDGREWKEFPL